MEILLSWLWDSDHWTSILKYVSCLSAKLGSAHILGGHNAMLCHKFNCYHLPQGLCSQDHTSKLKLYIIWRYSWNNTHCCYRRKLIYSQEKDITIPGLTQISSKSFVIYTIQHAMKNNQAYKRRGCNGWVRKINNRKKAQTCYQNYQVWFIK